MSEFPFRFYGSRPRDWFEGANMGHHYEIRFAEEPTPEQQQALGEVWAQQTAKGIVDPGLWTWAGPFALVNLGERRASEYDAFFRKVETILRAIHEVVPIDQVVFWGARDVTDGPWEAWTLAQQPTPTPGPADPRYAPRSWYGQQRDPAYPHLAPSGDFQQGYNSAEIEEEEPTPEPPPAVSSEAAADLSAAVATIETFLKDYTMRDAYWDDGEPRVWVQYTSPNAGRTAVEVMFACHDDTDPDLIALCEQALEAARASHPNLGFTIAHDIYGD